jgi:hypothetical protein
MPVLQVCKVFNLSEMPDLSLGFDSGAGLLLHQLDFVDLTLLALPDFIMFMV